MTNSHFSFCFSSKASSALFVALVMTFISALATGQQPKLHPPHLNPPPLPRTSPSSRPVQAIPALSTIPAAGPTLSQSTWSAIGPASLDSGSGLDSGRITGVAVDPTNSNTIYIAAAGGGVWKTTDGGTTWTPLTDNQTTLSMGSIAIAPTDHLKIYAGTGEANNSIDSNHGDGILVSNDGGSTWTLETASGGFAGVDIGQIAVDPTNENVAYAAVGGYGENGNYFTNEGIWKTTDGGATWGNTTAGVEPYSRFFGWTSVVVDPNTPSIVYAAAGDIQYSTYAGYTVNGVYRSTDSGATWALLANAPNGSSNSATGRIALAVSPAANSSGHHVLYVAVESISTSGLLYFERSDNADATTPTFTNLSGTPNFMGSQGWYDIGLNVDANGVVYAAGVSYGSNILRSTNLGVTWNDITVISGVEPHTDHHAIVFDSSNRMLLGNDGGIWRYDSTIPSWTDFNGNLNTIQFYGIGLHPTSATTVVGGSQDNGTELYSNNTVWTETDGGDGAFSQFSQTNGSRCYADHPTGSFGTADFFRRSDDGCQTWTSETSGFVNANSDWTPPFVVDPTNGNHLLIGLDRVYESTNGATAWTAISTPGSNGFNNTNTVDTVALAPANGFNPEVIYAATGDSNGGSLIFVSTDDGAVWNERDLSTCSASGHYSSGCRVNQIVTDPDDTTGQTAIAVTNNFTGGGQHVYRTINAGSTWTDISSALPDLPTWSAQVDTDVSHTIYISNDTGVYSSPSPYSTWNAYGAGLPSAQGYDLELNRSLHVLAVATHGRGAWEILTPSGGNTAATMASPAPGTLTGASTTFTWNPGSGGALTYYLWIGTTPGGYDLANMGPFSGTSATVTLPTNGVTIYVRLWTFINGGATQLHNDYTYTEASVSAGAINSPLNGSTLTSASTTFNWSAGSGGTITYYLWVGTAAGTANLINMGPISGTSATVTLPTGGNPIYVRLWTFINGGATQLHNDYTYTEATVSAGAINSPLNGSTLTSASTTFNWTAGSGGALTYYLWVGTSLGTANLINMGPISGTSATVTLPTNGVTIYVRLWTFINGGATQLHNDYTYTEATVSAGAINSPLNGSTLTSASTTFNWTAGSGGALTYYLWVGTSPGTANLINMGPISGTSATVTLPTGGNPIYVRLWTFINGGATQLHNDYTYTEATVSAGAINSPLNGSTLTSASTTFNWTAGSGGALTYYLWVGTSPGTANLINMGPISGTSATVTLPTNGVTIYVRLWTFINGGTTQLSNDYSYKEAGP